MASQKIRKNDTVVVISGAYKGKVSTVLALDPKNNLVTLKDVNKKTKHIKPNQQNQDGGIEIKEFPIHISNVAILVKKGTASTPATYSRVGFSIDKNNKKQRVVKKTNKTF
ncbi:50S ribosomal protein L24 [Mycoplasma zalophi]|uniref:Large ribosomal subunit protein uL24 n=1 Tax=Mycoplasma zalophi TaxID=191287 RepID=A0ABS6DQN8_9MOLU|nr:50S ribosomal protein L24 [Mycoplasma zalophi]MBU4691337.1 50S ribosomal protein L24 [Mycoplasma zalophi]MBU4692563.1 50S ribosomal protein L24 [Mycoplasma zalophi]